MKCSILLLFLFCISQQCSASIDGIDGIPYLSQLKSIYQLLGGDKEGAIRTQENFINETRFISQLNSFKQIINGDVGDAEGIQEQLGKILEETANEIPIVGQIKGVYHVAAGDTEKGVQVINTASHSSAVALGTLAGGPAGAIAGSLLYDALQSGIQSAMNREDKPQEEFD